MNNIYPYPMEGDVVSYKNRHGEYVFGRIVISADSAMSVVGGGHKMFIGNVGSIYEIAKGMDLQWIERKDGTPLVNVGDRVSDVSGVFDVLEVGINSYMVDDSYYGMKWKSYRSTEFYRIERKHPLPDVENKKTESITAKEVTMEEIAKKFGVDRVIIKDYKK